MTIIATEAFKKAYSEIPKEIQQKFKQKLEFFAENPAHPSLKMHRINDYWEFYVDRKYRCILRKDDDRYYLMVIGGHEIIDRFRFTLRWD